MRYLLLLAQGNLGDGASDLSGDERLSTTRALVVKEDAVASVHAIGLTVVDGDPESIQLGNAFQVSMLVGKEVKGFSR